MPPILLPIAGCILAAALITVYVLSVIRGRH
jgi:hypothetical protein